MKMVRIAKMPYIVEDTDRWGRAEGTYSVVDIQGEMEVGMWIKVQEFEGYNLSNEALAEQQVLRAEIEARIKKETLHRFETTEMIKFLPYMTKVINYCGSQLWQFKLRTSDIDNDSDYIRSYGIFGEKTLQEWTPEHDVKVAELRIEAARLSNKPKP